MGLQIIVLHPCLYADHAHLFGNSGSGNKSSSFMGCRALHGDIKLVLYNQGHVAVNSAVDIEIPGSHRRDFEFIFLPVADSNHQDIILAFQHVSGNVEVEGSVAAFMVAKIFAVNPDLAVFLDTFKFHEDLFICDISIDLETFPVPSPSVPPVWIIAFGRILDERDAALL